MTFVESPGNPSARRASLRARAARNEEEVGGLAHRTLPGPAIACMVLIIVAMQAARAISSERARRTLDSLLITPLDNRTIRLDLSIAPSASLAGASLVVEVQATDVRGDVQPWAPAGVVHVT